MVDTSVARATDGTLWMSLNNLDPNRAARVATNLSGTARGRILTATAMDAHNTFDNPAAVQPTVYSANSVSGKLTFDLPAKSIVVVRIDQ
jgi:alpha-N-arabinofuranosidase